MTNFVAPSEQDLRAAVRKQMQFIANSGNLVTSGQPDEAVRIAVALRVLLYDTAASTSSSQSLLGQLGWKSQLLYVNSLRPLELMPGANMWFTTSEGERGGETFGLVVLGADQTGGIQYVAPLGRDPVTATSDFDSWWNDKVLYSQGSPTFSRWDLIEAMAHKDGGAHVDPRGLRRDYAQFKLQGHGGLSVSVDASAPLPQTFPMERAQYLGDAAAPSVLQIGWELLETLGRAGLPDGNLAIAAGDDEKAPPDR